MMTRRWILGLAAIAALAACKKDKAATTDKPVEGSAASGSAATTPKPATGEINGSGSTFSAAYQETAIEAYTNAHPGTKVNYSGGGSGKGRQDLADMVVDFAGSDSAFKDEDLGKIKGGDILYFPILLGAITVTYNVSGVDKLQLSAETIAKIFQREIKTWNDPAIAADNPGAKLPSTAIVVVHRADGSGTTDNFTKYLDKAAAGVWKLKSGSTVEWSADTQAGQGNGGVAQLVKSTAGAIGYVDLPDAKASGLKYASVKNAAGKFIEPTSASASAAGETVEVKDNLIFSAINAAGDAAYPITCQTWVIVYAKPGAKGALLKSYVEYLVTEGQQLLTELDFAPLPKALQDKAIAQLAKIQL
jgi:phosphate transport system substrate-binding protein